MGFWSRTFTWWNGATWGTGLWTRLYGEEVGRDDAGNGPVGTDKDHVEGNERILHPEAGVCRRVPREDHAAIGRQRLAVHQALGLLFGGLRHLHCKAMGARCGLNGQRHLLKSGGGTFECGFGRRG